MTAFSFNAFPAFNSSTLQAKPQCTSRCCLGDSGIKTIYIASSSGPWFGLRKNKKDRKLGLFSLAAESNPVATNSTEEKSGNADDQLSTTVDSPSNGISNSAKVELGNQTRDASNGVAAPSDVKVDTVSSPKTLKRSSLTAREKLRAARVLNRSAASKPPKSEFGSKVLDALRESERGKKKSRLPEAPTNLLDDSKRGMPKQGLTFDFPGGFDLFVIVLSFVLITATMLATTYVVWKLGAIHFNDN